MKQIYFSECNLSSKQKEKVIPLLKQFSYVFSKSDSDFGLTNLIEHRIGFIDKTSIGYPDRAISHHLLKESKE